MTDHFKGRQFNQSVITFAVGYYLRYNISYRDLVEMMRDRGIFVHHTNLMRWVQHYSPIMRALWRKRHRRTSKRGVQTFFWTFNLRQPCSDGILAGSFLLKLFFFVWCYTTRYTGRVLC